MSNDAGQPQPVKNDNPPAKKDQVKQNNPKICDNDKNLFKVEPRDFTLAKKDDNSTGVNKEPVDKTKKNTSISSSSDSQLFKNKVQSKHTTDEILIKNPDYDSANKRWTYPQTIFDQDNAVKSQKQDNTNFQIKPQDDFNSIPVEDSVVTITSGNLPRNSVEKEYKVHVSSDSTLWSAWFSQKDDLLSKKGDKVAAVSMGLFATIAKNNIGKIPTDNTLHDITIGTNAKVDVSEIKAMVTGLLDAGKNLNLPQDKFSKNIIATVLEKFLPLAIENSINQNQIRDTEGLQYLAKEGGKPVRDAIVIVSLSLATSAVLMAAKASKMKEGDPQKSILLSTALGALKNAGHMLAIAVKEDKSAIEINLQKQDFVKTLGMILGFFPEIKIPAVISQFFTVRDDVRVSDTVVPNIFDAAIKSTRSNSEISNLHIKTDKMVTDLLNFIPKHFTGKADVIRLGQTLANTFHSGYNHKVPKR